MTVFFDVWARFRACWGLSRATTRTQIADSVGRHPAGKSRA